MKKTRKSTKGVLNARLIELLPKISVLSRAEIIQYITNKTDWGLATKQIDNYIAKCNKLLEKQTEKYKKKALDFTVNNFMDCYKAAQEEEDIVTCVNIQKEIGKLFGLYIQKTDITSKGDKVEGVTLVTADRNTTDYETLMKKRNSKDEK